MMVSVFWWSMRLLSLAAATYGGLCAVGCALENQLVYHPSVYPAGTWEPPGLVVEDAWFESADGAKLHGWYCEHPQPRAVVLMAHGNAGNLSDRWPMLRTLRERLEVSVMLFDYRGYGRSEGSPHETGVLDDARAARAWLAQRTGKAESDIVLYGESLGGGVMVDLASKDGARGLMLQSTFTSLPDVAQRHFPFLPVHWLMRNRLDSLSKIRAYRGPLLMAHGDADRLIPWQDAQRLHDAAASTPKRLLLVPGADHNWAWTEDYVQAMDQFIAALP